MAEKADAVFKIEGKELPKVMTQGIAGGIRKASKRKSRAQIIALEEKTLFYFLCIEHEVPKNFMVSRR